MSTTINVTVGGNGLLDQSRQQMQANRFGRLEGDQDAKTTAEASKQQQAQQPNTDGTRIARRIYPEPAATRRDAVKVSLSHFWYCLGDSVTTSASGITGGNFGGNTSRTTSQFTSIRRTIGFGCGDGSQWIDVDLVDLTIPPPPADDWTVTSEEPLNPIFNTINGTATRTVRVWSDGFDDWGVVVLPTGKQSSIILVFAYAYASTVQLSAVKHYYERQPSETVPRAVESISASVYPGVDDWGWDTATSSYDFFKTVRAFTCSNTAIRELSLPATLAAMVDASIMPDGGDKTATNYFPYFFSGTVPPDYKGKPFNYQYRQIHSEVDGFDSQDGTGYSTISYRDQTVYSPAIFSLLQQLTDFTEAASILEFDNSKDRIAHPDMSRGAYSSFVPSSGNTPDYNLLYGSEDRPFCYALWGVPGEYPDFTYYDPGSTLDVPPPKRLAKSDLTLSAERQAQGSSVAMGITLDWGNPQYCTSMCKLLGFSDLDLVP